MKGWKRHAAAAAASLLMASTSEAQTREFMLRGFADVGSTTFDAAQSFDAVLGSHHGAVFGGGIEAILPQRIFISFRGSRFRGTGERVFLFKGERFGLGIPTTVSITPLELTGGYRFRRVWRLVPYGGGGIGWHLYKETSEFAEGAENVKDHFSGYHVLAGGEIPLARWLAAAGEAQWATVPEALGSGPNGVSQEFGESNLGGFTVRVKFVLGR